MKRQRNVAANRKNSVNRSSKLQLAADSKRRSCDKYSTDSSSVSNSPRSKFFDEDRFAGPASPFIVENTAKQLKELILFNVMWSHLQHWLVGLVFANCIIKTKEVERRSTFVFLC